MVLPLVSSSIAELATCNSGLNALVLAIETRILENLNACLKTFFGQVSVYLLNVCGMIERDLKSDFVLFFSTCSIL